MIRTERLSLARCVKWHFKRNGMISKETGQALCRQFFNIIPAMRKLMQEDLAGRRGSGFSSSLLIRGGRDISPVSSRCRHRETGGIR